MSRFSVNVKAVGDITGPEPPQYAVDLMEYHRDFIETRTVLFTNFLKAVDFGMKLTMLFDCEINVSHNLIFGTENCNW